MGSLRLYTFRKKPQWLIFVHAGNVSLTGTSRRGLTSFLRPAWSCAQQGFTHSGFLSSLQYPTPSEQGSPCVAQAGFKVGTLLLQPPEQEMAECAAIAVFSSKGITLSRLQPGSQNCI